jgi:hypothetical protein
MLGKLTGFLSAVLLFALMATRATASTPMPVHVEATSNDGVGQSLIFAVRERIRASSGMVLTDSYQTAKFLMKIITDDPDKEDSGAQSRTYYAATLTLASARRDQTELYIETRLGTCGRNRIEQCALRLVAILDEEISTYRQLREETQRANPPLR